MDFSSKLSGDIKVWHYSLSVAEIENAFSAAASDAHNRGEVRSRGDKSPYRDSYCRFEICAPEVADFGSVLERCLAVLDRALLSEPRLLKPDGRATIVTKVWDKEFVQLFLDDELVARLHRSGASLNIENRG